MDPQPGRARLPVDEYVGHRLDAPAVRCARCSVAGLSKCMRPSLRREPLAASRPGRPHPPADGCARHRLDVHVVHRVPRAAPRPSPPDFGKPRSGAMLAGTAPRTTDWPCRTHGAVAGACIRRVHRPPARRPSSGSAGSSSVRTREVRPDIRTLPLRDGPARGIADPASRATITRPGVRACLRIGFRPGTLVQAPRAPRAPGGSCGDPPPDSVRPDPESPNREPPRDFICDPSCPHSWIRCPKWVTRKFRRTHGLKDARRPGPAENRRAACIPRPA